MEWLYVNLCLVMRDIGQVSDHQPSPMYPSAR